MSKKRVKTESLKNPIFVIGMPRSGTTVISEAISAHPELGWLSNYVKWFPSIPQLSLLSKIIDIPYFGWFLRGKKSQNQKYLNFYRSLLPFCSEAYTVWTKFCKSDFDTDYLMNVHASDNEKIKIKDYISKILFYQRKMRFFSKLTGPPRIYYLNSIFPDAYFIHITRDPRANIHSLLKVPFWKDNEGYTKPWWENGLSEKSIQDWETYKKSPIALCAVQWKEVNEQALKEKGEICSKRYCLIRYEDFVKNPFEILDSTLKIVGLPFSNKISYYINTIAKVQDMNFKFKSHFNKKDIDIIERITFETAAKFGYKI